MQMVYGNTIFQRISPTSIETFPTFVFNSVYCLTKMSLKSQTVLECVDKHRSDMWTTRLQLIHKLILETSLYPLIE